VAKINIDDVNLTYAVTPETFTDIVDLIVPELQRRGVDDAIYREVILDGLEPCAASACLMYLSVTSPSRVPRAAAA